MDRAREFFERMNDEVARWGLDAAPRFFELPFALIGDAGTEIAYDRDDLGALSEMDISRAIAAGELAFDWEIVARRACGSALTTLRTEVVLTPKGGAPSDPFYICRVVRITPEGPRLVAMINPPAFTRTARGLPVRSGGVETDAPVTPAVETVIRGMAEAMVGEDPDALREICSSPVVWIADEGTLVMDETNFEERFAALRKARLDHGGAAPFEFEVESETSYGDALSLVRCQITMTGPDGRPLDPFQAEFVLRRSGEELRLAAMINLFGGRFWPTA